VADGKIVFRVDEERRLPPMDAKSVLAYSPDAILISDYDKGSLSEETIAAIIDECRRRKIPVVSDAKRRPQVYAGSVLKCNADYESRFLGRGAKFAFGAVVTRGPEAPTVNGELVYAAPSRTPCRNHVGAGDCFAAHLTLALAHGFSLVEAAAIAHSAGRVYVQHEHNRAPWPHEVRRDFDQVGGKVIAQPNVLRLANPMAKIVWTNGVFRIGAHAGHAWLLNWARQQGDVLVIGVNDDASAARVRPGDFVLPLEERCHILASMECVDWVVPFSEDRPDAAIAAVRPNVLVKGQDYEAADVHGAHWVHDVRIAPQSPFPRHATELVASIHGVRRSVTSG